MFHELQTRVFQVQGFLCSKAFWWYLKIVCQSFWDVFKRKNWKKIYQSDDAKSKFWILCQIWDQLNVPEMPRFCPLITTYLFEILENRKCVGWAKCHWFRRINRARLPNFYPIVWSLPLFSANFRFYGNLQFSARVVTRSMTHLSPCLITHKKVLGW